MARFAILNMSAVEPIPATGTARVDIFDSNDTVLPLSDCQAHLK
jgi:hypothetical protein